MSVCDTSLIIHVHDLSKYTVPTKVVGMLVVSDLSTKVVGMLASKQIQ